MQRCYGAAVAAVQASFWALFPGHLELAARRPSPARPGPLATLGLLPVSEPSSTPGPLAHPQAAGAGGGGAVAECLSHLVTHTAHSCLHTQHTQPVHTLPALARSHTRHSVKVKLQELRLTAGGGLQGRASAPRRPRTPRGCEARSWASAALARGLL